MTRHARWFFRATFTATVLLSCAVIFWPQRQPTLIAPPPEAAAPQPETVQTKAQRTVAFEGAPIRPRYADFWPQRPHAIPLHSRNVLVSTDVPPGIDPEAPRVWLAQFGGPIDDTSRQILKNCDVELLLPSAEMAWHVRASSSALLKAKQESHPALLGWAILNPEDKYLPAIRRQKKPPASLRLELYHSADPHRVAAAVRALNGEIRTQGSDFVEVDAGNRLPAEFLKEVASLDDVYALNVPRPALRAFNAQASNASNITGCRGAPRNLDGSGINVLVRDDGPPFAHPDFGARVTLGADVLAMPATQHATHVSGTVGGSGSLNAAATGMAPACNLIIMDLSGDDFNEPLSGKNSFNALLSNHSYGFVTGWDSGSFTSNQGTFGQYDSFARNWDVLVRNENLLMVKAVGNDRNDSGSGFPHDGTLGSDGEYYDCIEASSTGKNILAVGAALDSAQSGTPNTGIVVTPGSGAGPCDDGRLRPEIIANGDAVFSCNNSAVPGSEYTTLTGTSMAAAVVTGATALFIQRYQQRFGAGTFPAPHFLRATYAETATDMGRPGPDYLHGFGMLDLDAALTLFETDNGTGTRLHNGTIDANVPERFFALTSDGVTPIQATLCWTDEPGDLLTVRALVNDLDLRLIRVSDQSETLPFVLSASSPAQPAFNAVNSVDTIEQVHLLTPSAGQYLLAVKGTKLATAANFTLASSHALVENLAPLAKITPSTTMGSPPLLVTFSGTESVDPDGFISQYIWDFGDGTSSSGASVQHVFSAGSFAVTLKVIDGGGASASTSVNLGVANQVPIAVASATPDAGLPPLSLLFSSAGSSDPDGTIVDFTWDFGDGTTGKGANIAHTYPAAGFYYATLTVTDNGGAAAKINVSVLAGKTFTPRTSRFGLNFKRIASDKFTLVTKTLPCDLLLDPAGLSGSISIGLLEYRFTLDSKGRYRLPPLNIQFRPSKSMLRVTISRTNLIPSLAGFGLRNEDTKNRLVRVPFAIAFDDGSVFGYTGLIYSYTARRGTSGAAIFKP